jgi:hypothetical protein
MSTNFEGTSPLVSDRYVITAIADTGQTITAGQVVYVSTAGYPPVVSVTAGANKSCIGVALTNAIAGQTLSVICRGITRVVTSSTNGGVVTVGQRIISDASGAVQAVPAMAAPASYATNSIQAQLDKTEQWIGRALTASSAAGTTIYILLNCLP